MHHILKYITATLVGLGIEQQQAARRAAFPLSGFGYLLYKGRIHYKMKRKTEKPPFFGPFTCRSR